MLQSKGGVPGVGSN